MVTLADIFAQHGAAYQQQFGVQMLPSHRQTMQAIYQCRTAALGGRVYTCQSCDHTEYRYHSCCNRHCPQCQGDNAQQWLTRQQEMLLPVPYYLLTFTLPAALRPLARSQQKLFYNLLFRASAAATQQLAQNPRWLGGTIAMMGVLHTWDVLCPIICTSTIWFRLVPKMGWCGVTAVPAVSCSRSKRYPASFALSFVMA